MLQSAGFIRTIVYCNDTTKCGKTLGITEISERYQESRDSEYPSYKRIIDFERENQIFSRLFKDCKMDDNSTLLMKYIELEHFNNFKDYAVSLKFG